MGTTTRDRRTSRRTVSILAAIGLTVGILAGTASTAGASTCLAENGMASSSDLQTIIDGASTGDTIVVTGTCVGTFSIPGAGSATNLTVKGKKHATLDGNASGSVLSVGEGMTVTIKSLLITNGDAELGGGIYNSGTLSLIGRAKVGGNTAEYGGGVIVRSGVLNLSGRAAVTGNTASWSGAGIFNGEEGTVNMSGKTRVAGNTASGPSGNYGGGIFSNGGVLNLSGKARVTDNRAGFPDDYGFGGGISNWGGTVTMSGGAEVTSNMASVNGGGIQTTPSGTLVGTIAGVNVRSNMPDDIFVFGI